MLKLFISISRCFLDWLKGNLKFVYDLNVDVKKNGCNL